MRKQLALAETEHGPDKPRFGEPCNGCGFCCAAEVCEIGRALHGDDCPAPCPSLEWAGNRFGCGAIRLADGISPAHGLYLRLRLGIGMGCDADDFERDSDVKA